MIFVRCQQFKKSLSSRFLTLKKLDQFTDVKMASIIKETVIDLDFAGASKSTFVNSCRLLTLDSLLSLKKQLTRH